MSEKEALELLERANKKATQTGFFSGPKRDEAAELYTKAANNFKMAKKWKEAGDAYTKTAEMHILLGERDEAALSFMTASKKAAVDVLKQAVAILTENGRFHQAANQMKEVAQIYEADLIDLENSMKAYETAADWLANGCLLKVATFAAQLEQYEKAIQVFEQVASNSLDNALMKFSLKEYFLKDSIGTRRAIDRYAELDITFPGTREYKFLMNLAEAIENEDVEAFTAVVVEYDQLTKLDTWKTTLLLKIKKGIEEEEIT